MKVVVSDNFDKFDFSTAIAIGSFDGLHRGHKRIITKTAKIADRLGVRSGVYSFHPHPREVITPQKSLSFLISRNQKINLLEKMNIEYYFEQKFDHEFADKKFIEFIEEILNKKLNVKQVVIGDDFTFGYNGEGDAAKLKELGDYYGFKVTIIMAVKKDDKKISSTRIRNLIRKGELQKASRLLDRYYSLEGKVVHGCGRGRDLGIPTANLDLTTNYVLPPSGVYACYIKLGCRKHAGIVNFGHNPTFSDNEYSVEVHIFDFDQDIYGEMLEIELVETIRGEMTFSSSKDLVNQIKEDILYTKKLLC